MDKASEADKAAILKANGESCSFTLNTISVDNRLYIKLSDIAGMIGGDMDDMLKSLDEPGKYIVKHGTFDAEPMMYINEPGFYMILMHSDSQISRKMIGWVCNKVIPSRMECAYDGMSVKYVPGFIKVDDVNMSEIVLHISPDDLFGNILFFSPDVIKKEAQRSDKTTDR